MNPKDRAFTETAVRWNNIFFLTILSIYFYIFMEWLFLITKPSFMSVLGPIDTIRVFLVAPVPIVAACFILLLLLKIPMIYKNSHIPASVSLSIAQLIPAVVFSCSFFLLIDNFTYTVFKFGVISTSGVFRYFYAMLLLVLTIIFYMRLSSIKNVPGILKIIKSILLFVSVAAVLFFFYAEKDNNDVNNTIKSPVLNKPNILLLSSDGLNAENMSVYGYHRSTTPFLSQIAGKSLFVENCFTNAGPTGASIASIFTGRLPTQTRLIFPPDILRGKDVYQHLPGILKKEGYKSIDLSIRHYADPYDLNLRNSFDSANFREIRKNNISNFFLSLLGQDPSYFLGVLTDRIRERLLHTIGVHNMDDVFTKVVKAEKKYNDAKRINELLSFIDATPSHFFAHVHLMGTHGPRFYPKQRIYSAGQEQNNTWMSDFYDDSILNFDYQVKEIFQALEERGRLDNTLVIIHTDHAAKHTIDKRVPLFFLFPGNDNQGRIKANAQNLDIAPTILDYLGIDKPDWMSGASLISSTLESDRFILMVDRKKDSGSTTKDKGFRQLDKTINIPPFYSLGTIGVVFYDRLFMMNIERKFFTAGKISGHTAPCSSEMVPDKKEVFRFLMEHLEKNNYDTSSIPEDLVIKPSNWLPATFSRQGELEYSSGEHETFLTSIENGEYLKGLFVDGRLEVNSPTRFSVITAGETTDLYYRFSVHPDYGSDGYDGKKWSVMTNEEYTDQNSIDYSFNKPGKYIVVVWVVTDKSGKNVHGVPIMGCSVEIGGDDCRTNIRGYNVSGMLKAGSPVGFTVNAENSCSDNLYYRFSVHPDYGTENFDGRRWTSMTATEWISVNSTDYTFTESGKYIVIVWVADDPDHFDSRGIPIIGWSVDIE